MLARNSLSLVAVCCVAFTSCSSLSSALSSGDPPTVGSEETVKVEEFKLDAGDKIHLTVFGEEAISGDYVIDTEGFISIPLAGLVKAGGLRKIELEREVTVRLTGMLRNPRVNVAVVEFRPFYILGEVEKPGEYPFKSGLNALSAIAIAGGTTYRASKTRILIQRGGVGDFTEYQMSPRIKVYPGDLIRIPERLF